MYGSVVSGLKPKNVVTGLATHVAKEPLTENTRNIATNCQFDVRPHFCFNFSIINANLVIQKCLL
jgi:hypothetical protein